MSEHSHSFSSLFFNERRPLLGTGTPLSPFIPDENTQGITLKPAAMARQELLLLLGSAPVLSEQGVLRA